MVVACIVVIAVGVSVVPRLYSYYLAVTYALESHSPPPLPFFRMGTTRPFVWSVVSVLCAAEGGLKGAHAEEWVSLGALSAISLALEVRRRRW